jgi:hypothetical protein
MRRIALAFAVLAAALAACDHIEIGPVRPSCPVCDGPGRG